MARICTRVKLPDGTVALVTTEQRGNPNEPCGFCVKTRDKQPAKHTALCDFPIHKGKDTKRYTCSRRLCASCTFSPAEGVDFCPTHAVVVADHGLTARLVPLIKDSHPHAHKVALDLVDQVLMMVASSPETQKRYMPKGLVDWHEFFTERAAIYEYEAGLPRAEAERRARADAGLRPQPTPQKERR
jgi:hypothetical protein